MRAYDEIYLASAQDNLAAMFDYGINVCHVASGEFWARFIASGIASSFASGNPGYVAGRAGSELALIAMKRTGLEIKTPPCYVLKEASPEYWAGWAIAYYQWLRAVDFATLSARGLSFPKIVSLYHPLHEADITKFVSVADSIFASQTSSPLRRARTNIGLTQQELADASEVTLRMIRAYEQKSQDIRKAEAETVMRIARVLHVTPQFLLNF